jgi:hypothetical protein
MNGQGAVGRSNWVFSGLYTVSTTLNHFMHINRQ